MAAVLIPKAITSRAITLLNGDEEWLTSRRIFTYPCAGSKVSAICLSDFTMAASCTSAPMMTWAPPVSSVSIALWSTGAALIVIEL